MAHTGNSDDAVDGMVFELTAAELQSADDYEVDDDVRIETKLRSGARAWLYVARG